MGLHPNLPVSVSILTFMLGQELAFVCLLAGQKT